MRVYGFAAFLLVLLAVALVVVYALLQDNSRRDTRPIEAESVEAEPVRVEGQPEQSESELASLLRRHREVSGLQDVNGLTLHGSYFEDGRRFEMALSMRKPDLIRKNVRDPDIDIIVVSDGNAGELRITPKPGEPTVRALGADDLHRITLALEGAAFRLAETPGQGDDRYELLSEEAGEGLRRIASTGPAGVPLTHVIDEATGLEVERSVAARVDGTHNVLKLLLDDHRRVDGVMLPHRYRLQVNGRERVEIQVESVQLNPGLTPWFFALEQDESDR